MDFSRNGILECENESLRRELDQTQQDLDRVRKEYHKLVISINKLAKSCRNESSLDDILSVYSSKPIEGNLLDQIQQLLDTDHIICISNDQEKEIIYKSSRDNNLSCYRRISPNEGLCLPHERDHIDATDVREYIRECMDENVCSPVPSLSVYKNDGRLLRELKKALS